MTNINPSLNEDHLIILYFNQPYYRNCILLVPYLSQFGKVCIYGDINYDAPQSVLKIKGSDTNQPSLEPCSAGHFGYRALLDVWEKGISAARYTLVHDDVIIIPRGWEQVITSTTSWAYHNPKPISTCGDWYWARHPTGLTILDEEEVYYAGWGADFYSITAPDMNVFCTELDKMSQKDVFLEIAVPSAFRRSGIVFHELPSLAYHPCLKLSSEENRNIFFKLILQNRIF